MAGCPSPTSTALAMAAAILTHPTHGVTYASSRFLASGGTTAWQRPPYNRRDPRSPVLSTTGSALCPQPPRGYQTPIAFLICQRIQLILLAGHCSGTPPSLRLR